MLALSRAKKCQIGVHAVCCSRFASSLSSTERAYCRVYKGDEWDDVKKRFKWRIPEFFNIASAVLDRHCGVASSAAFDTRDFPIFDEGSSVAIYDDGTAHSFGQLRRASVVLARALHVLGVRKGDRVALHLPQCAATVLGHTSVWRLGALSLPLFPLFGSAALQYRLSDSQATVLLTSLSQLDKVRPLLQHTEVRHVIVCDGHFYDDAGTSRGRVKVPRSCGDNARGDNIEMHALHDLLREFDNDDECTKIDEIVDASTFTTKANDGAVIIYTSGSTGPPKGCVHAHRVLLGHLPGVELPHQCFPQPGEVTWTPACWAWIGGLFDVLMPSLFHGVSVVAHRARKFDARDTLELVQRRRVTATFLPPTALKLLRRQLGDHCGEKIRLMYPHMRLRSVAAGGESLGQDIRDWCLETFGTTVDEFYGQTECNLVCTNAHELFPSIGGIGRSVPGKRVVILRDESDNVASVHEEGEIAVHTSDPAMMLGYWNKTVPEKFTKDGKFMRTGDRGYCTEAGDFVFVGRDDDIITSSGYRVGPSPIEAALQELPEVALAAVVGKKDPVRTEVVVAFVQLQEHVKPTEELAMRLKEHVRQRVAQHEYPREVHFVEEMPCTATGKLLRSKLRQHANDPVGCPL
ncbi:MAG: hypothetical protein MHM6MM_000179 [Cercozoa sp. M6MM]